MTDLPPAAAAPSPAPPSLAPTDRTRSRRHRDRVDYEIDLVRGILEEAFICHVACHDGGTTWMVPTAYGLHDDELLLHGAAANHMFKAAAAGAQLVVTVTLVDAMVLARSTFNHSINYRSVVVFGQARHVTDPDDKVAALERIVEHMLPGRSAEARPPAPNELRQTIVVALPITEASAKVRTGPPGDSDEPDAELPVWAGTIDLRTTAGLPVAAPGLNQDALDTGPSASWALQPRWAPGA
jgi:nitroimidazol reductase NimA-like FMN-containing flavoprotein (pyridoxamine 5'-phosphate oxidase superfamily)